MPDPPARAGRSPRRLLRLDPRARTGFLAMTVLAALDAALRLARAVALAALTQALLTATTGGRSLPAVVVLAFSGSVVAGAAVSGAARLVGSSASGAMKARLAKRLVRRRLGVHGGAASDAQLATTGLDRLDAVVGEQWPAVVRAAVLIPAAAVLLLIADPMAALAGAAVLPVLPLLGAVIGIRTAERTRATWREALQLGGFFLDSVQGVVALRLHGRAEERGAAIASASDRHRRLTLLVLRTAFVNTAATSLAASMGVALVAVVEGTRLAEGQVPLAPALLAVVVAPLLYRPVVDLGSRFHLDAEAAAVLTDLETALDESTAPAPDRAERTEVTDLTATRGARSVPALDHLDAVFPSGELTAVVGQSGAGKSTLLAVLAGLPVQRTGTASVGGLTRYLPQEPHFPLALTIDDAIRLPSASTGSMSVEQAMHLAALTDFDPVSPVAALSMGQRQRVALARAYYGASAHGAVLLLDEPTAHLDPATEALVLTRMRRWAESGDATVVMAAHRPAAIAAAHRTVQLEDQRPYPSPAPPISPDDIGARPPAGRGPARDLDESVPTARPPRRRGRLVGAIAAGSIANLFDAALPATGGMLIVLAAGHPPLLALSFAIVLVRLWALGKPLLRYLERFLTHDAALSNLTALRTDVWRRLVPRAPGPVLPSRGDLLTRLARDVDDQADATIRGPWATAALLSGLATGMVAITMVAPSSAGAMVVAVAVTAAWALLVGPAVQARTTRRLRAVRGRRAAGIVDVLAAGADLIGNGADPAALLRDLEHDYLRTQKNQTIREVLLDLPATVLAGLLPSLAVLSIARSPGLLDAPVAAALVLGASVLAEQTQSLAAAGTALRLRREARGRLAEAVGAPASSVDPEESARRPIPGRSGSLDFERVSASWRGPAVLGGLDLHLRTGARTAITGASGSGKSTLAATTLHLLDPSAGAVRLDDVAYTQLTGAEVRRRIGAIGVADHVFSLTVRENLTLGEEGFDDRRILQVLDVLRLRPWLADLPDGLDTLLGSGSGGVVPSGGQALRLAAGRTLLRHPAVLVLDEPTEGLDPPTARALLADIARTDPEQTWLLLTHRTEGLDLVATTLELRAGAVHSAMPDLSPEES